MKERNYQSNLCSGSLLVSESKKIAELLLLNPAPEVWQHKIVVENILQKNSVVTAKKQAELIKARLNTLRTEAFSMIVGNDSDLAVQILLVAAIKGNHLLGDFLQIVKRKWQAFENILSKKDWYSFLEECEQVSPNVRKWGSATKDKLGEVVFRILAEAKIIENTRNKKLITFQLNSNVFNYLYENHEKYVLECLEWQK